MKFNLSDYIWDEVPDRGIKLDYIKEFIKRLKKEIKQHLDFADVDGRKIVYHMTDKDYDEFFDIINRLAGENLI